MDSMLVREAALQERRRQQLDDLKHERKERAKTSTSSNFSGKQKKQQLRARKHRLNVRRDEENEASAEARLEYEEFYADHVADKESRAKSMAKAKKGAKKGGDDDDKLLIMDDHMEGLDKDTYVDSVDFFEKNYDLTDNSIQSRLKLTVALGRHNKDNAGKELSSFFVKESKEQVYLRLMEGQQPLDLSGRKRPLLAKEIKRDPVLDHPRRPRWDYKMSKETVDDNESVMFDTWLTKIHDKYPNEELNHFEHNLEVWRELWRVTERATHVVVVTDVRNPLLHIPPSIYDHVTNELQKPMTLVLNKIDLVSPQVVELWKAYLKKRFPKCQLLTFSSRSTAVRGDTNISSRRRVLTTKLQVGDPSAIRGAVDILKSCGIAAAEAQRIAEDLNTHADEPELDALELLQLADAASDKQQKQRKSRRKQKGTTLFANAPTVSASATSSGVLPCQHCGTADAVFACFSCAGHSAEVAASITDEERAKSRGYLLCRRCDREEHVDLDAHHKFKLTAVRLSSKQQSQVNIQNAAKVTIGLIGHPNVGKSSVLNALAGKKLVSVSHTPGHTKRLQSIMLTPDICICDCPGLVFPFAGVAKYMQELCGMYPFSQIREPYSAVRFLAEHLVLEKVLDLKPRTQVFDGIEEELAWTPWTVCEAYAEKKGYRTERRGRPDHQRAGAELIRDTVDGIVPLFFLPPDFTGTSATELQRREPTNDAEADDEDDGSDEDEDSESEEEEEDDIVLVAPVKTKAPAAKVNAFSLLDSSSDDDSSSSSSDSD